MGKVVSVHEREGESEGVPDTGLAVGKGVLVLEGEGVEEMLGGRRVCAQVDAADAKVVASADEPWAQLKGGVICLHSQRPKLCVRRKTIVE